MKKDEIVTKIIILRMISNKINKKNRDQIYQIKELEDEIESIFQFYKLIQIKKIN
jgi:hypothetical protein